MVGEREEISRFSLNLISALISACLNHFHRGGLFLLCRTKSKCEEKCERKKRRKDATRDENKKEGKSSLWMNLKISSLIHKCISQF